MLRSSENGGRTRTHSNGTANGLPIFHSRDVLLSSITEIRFGLKSRSMGMRLHAVEVLCAAPNDAVELIDDTIELLKREDSVVIKFSAIQMLGKIGQTSGQKAEEIALALSGVLGNRTETDYIKTATAYSLGMMGSQAYPALNALANCLANGHESTRVASAWALGKIGYKASLQSLKNAAESDPSFEVRSAAVKSAELIEKKCSSGC